VRRAQQPLPHPARLCNIIPMNRKVLRIAHVIGLLLSVLLIAGCSGMFEPPPPLFDAGRYKTIAVLPARVVVKTGSPPFLAENTELTGKISGIAQEAVSTVMVVKGYDVMAPLDINDKLRDDKSLEEDFMNVAIRSGFMGDKGPPPEGYEAGEGAASRLAKTLGADMIILVHGSGEFHSFGENLVQSIVTDIISDGKKKSQSRPSYLTMELIFVDPAGERVEARMWTGKFTYSDTVPALSRNLETRMMRVPVRRVSGY